MTPRPTSAPGRPRPARRRSQPWLLLPVLVAVIAAGCIGAEQTTDEPSLTPTSTPTASTERTVEPTASAAATPTPAATEDVTPVPTASPAEPGPTPSPTGAAASGNACTGNDSNRTFFSQVAAAVDWPVYCAILPARWSVDSGQYRLAGGGWMRIAYTGPGGARFELAEGTFCDDPEGCVPLGPDAGQAAFGDMTGTLIAGDDGRDAVVVDRGAPRSWVATGVGLDTETFKRFAAALLRVED